MLFCLLLSFLLSILQAEKYLPLQILEHNIVMTYSEIPQLQFTDGSYLIQLKIPIESDDIPSIIYCWLKMQTERSKENQNCGLIENESKYRCIQVNYTRGQGIDAETIASNLSISWTELTISPRIGLSQIKTKSNLIYLPDKVQNLSRNVYLDTSYFQKYSIYRMITATSRAMIQNIYSKNTEAKINFLHTYTFVQYEGTLISQRNHYCILYDNKIIHLFEGVVSRAGVPHLFTSILTTTTNNLTFHMWGGSSYSSGHAARDMFGYESTTENFYDLYSLYAAAPFQDISSNIEGEKNVVRIANSGQSSIDAKGKQPFHFIQFYRAFETFDTKGDQIIMQKISNRFCYAAYFQNKNLNESSLSVLNNGFKHQLADCRIADLSISGWHLTLALPVILLILISY